MCRLTGLLQDLVIIGGVGTVAYVYKDEIHTFLKDNGLWPFPEPTPSGDCPTGQHKNSAGQCVPDSTCNKTCTPPQVLDANCNCVTPTPPPPTGGNISFSAAGDWGSGRNSNWKQTVATMKAFHPNVVLIPGDMSYTSTGDWKPVADAIKAFPAKLLGAQGNHDGSGYGSLFDAFSNSVTTIGNTSFMALNTESGSSAVTFAKANLSKMTGKWKVVFFHKPIYTVKSNHSPDEGGIGALVPEFEKAHVNLVIQAHNHNYQRFAPKNGVTYVVAGTGGESAYSIGSNCSSCPPIVKTSKSFGAFCVTTSSSNMTCKFNANSGGTVDSFSI